MLAHCDRLTPAQVGAAWTEHLVNQVGDFHGGGFSEMTAINNLRAGLDPPVAGSDNDERWSDGAAMRIAPIGVYCAGDPHEAARPAAIDAQVSHARDGNHCAKPPYGYRAKKLQLCVHLARAPGPMPTTSTRRTAAFDLQVCARVAAMIGRACGAPGCNMPNEAAPSPAHADPPQPEPP